jgi:hypothetical protein
VVIELAKVTLSVPDDFYEMLEKYKDRLNYSDIFRRAVSEEIEKIEKKGELIERLLHHISGQPQKIEEKARNEEIERFTKKWGEPDSKVNDEEPSHRYVTLLKKYKVKSEEQTIAELRISNSRSMTSLCERLERGFGKYDISLYNKNLEPIVDFFKSQGFIIAEEQLLQEGAMLYVLKIYGSQGREEYNRLKAKGYDYYGLFAADNEDSVLIAYREVKLK